MRNPYNILYSGHALAVVAALALAGCGNDEAHGAKCHASPAAE